MEECVGKGVKGLKIRSFNAWMIVGACILYAFLIYATGVVSERYEKLVVYTQEYIACEKNAAMVNDASDYLTEQVRLYAQNMDIKYLELYFEESNVTQRRERVLSELENHYSNGVLSDSLQEAIRHSNDLMEREIYSMKLICVANGYDMSMLPAEIQETVLEESDAVLDRAAMIEKARAMVFDAGYQEAKAQINEDISHFMKGVLTATEERQLDSVEGLSRAIYTQRLLLSILLLMNILTFIVITLFIVKPLQIYIRCIKDQTLLEASGAYEFKYLAETYNNIYKLNRASAANEAFLKHKAEHDPLTGLMNRSVFDQMDVLLKENRGPLALLLIDVDNFKQVNDGHGHEVGDRVLKKIAVLLETCFRTKDYWFRIGGDEFAGIVTDVAVEQAHVIEEKVLKMNAALQKPLDGLPVVSVSVGVAFSKEGYREDLYRQADQTLYLVKAQGRCGCRFYRELKKG